VHNASTIAAARITAAPSAPAAPATRAAADPATRAAAATTTCAAHATRASAEGGVRRPCRGHMHCARGMMVCLACSAGAGLLRTGRSCDRHERCTQDMMRAT